MEREWIMKLWRPTGVDAQDAPAAHPPERVAKAFEEISEKTAALTKTPYNAGLWASRAVLLVELGYPELAAGDSSKAQKLHTAMLDGTGLGLVARKQSLDFPGMMRVPAEMLHHQPAWVSLAREAAFENFMTLAQALQGTKDFRSLRDLCSEVGALYPGHDIFGGESASSDDAFNLYQKKLRQSGSLGDLDIEELLKTGLVQFRRYPFIAPEHLHRNAELISSANTQLLKLGAPCVIKASNSGISSSIPETPFKSLGVWKPAKDFFGYSSESESDTLGVFALCNIRKGDIIFEDHTTWGASNFAAVLPFETGHGHNAPMFRCDNCCGVTTPWNRVIHKPTCCKTIYCSKDCLETAKKTYHQVLCGKDFLWLKPKPGTKAESDLDGQLWLRILATCVQSGLHPLEHPSIASLTSSYETTNKEGARRWDLASHVDVPQRILMSLGVDIFKDLRYDTWVLQTIWARLISNERCEFGEMVQPTVVRSVHTLYSFINHSCEPNAVAQNLDSTYAPQTAPVFKSSSLAVTACRDIRAGEEITISYTDKLDMPREQRNLQLRRIWLPGDCWCTRCTREAQTELM